MSRFGIDDLILQTREFYSQNGQIISKNNEIFKSELNIALKSSNISGEIISYGSSSRKTAINEGLKSQYFPIDYDMLVVVSNELDRGKLKTLEKSLNCTKFKKSRGLRDVNYFREQFRVNVQIIPEVLTNSNNCFTYQLNCPSFNEEELEQIRTFKLFSQRNGIYSGFNKSIKGILIEQIILQFGGFEKSIETLAESFENNEILQINSCNSQDLVSRISKPCQNRIIQSYKELLSGNIAQSNLNLDRWNKLNSNKVNLKLNLKNQSSSNARTKLNGLLNEVLETKNLEYDIYAIESVDFNNLMFLSLDKFIIVQRNDLIEKIRDYEK
jgi:hypothetical protein